MKPEPHYAYREGFTLIEILMVIVIITLIIAFAWPAYESYVERSRYVDTTVQITTMQKTIHDYEISKGFLPNSLDEVGYTDKRDAWGRPYEYLNLRTLKGGGKARNDKGLKPLNSDFDLYSVGPDGLTDASLAKPESRDDVVRARDGKFVGLASVFDP